MKNDNSVLSTLHLDKIVFDKIEFKRLSFSSDKELELEISSNISKKQEADIYKVTLILEGNKPDEYILEISLTGYFSIMSNADLSDEMIRSLVSKNSVAILMPYMRSEVSLITAQPGMECVVLPAFNINNLLEQ